MEQRISVSRLDLSRRSRDKEYKAQAKHMLYIHIDRLLNVSLVQVLQLPRGLTVPLAKAILS